VKDIISVVTIVGLLGILVRELATSMSTHLAKPTKDAGIMMKYRTTYGSQKARRIALLGWIQPIAIGVFDALALTTK
jgi:hypothetical protein